MIWLYEAIGAIRDFIELGGNVLWAIMLVVFLMWTFILERLWYFYRVHPARKAAIIGAWESRSDTASWYAKRIREGLVSETSLALRQNVGLIRVLIAICPLLGLLGTVTGMIAVFDVMTYSGVGNARAMAGGVSMATVPTMAGMVAALSGVYFGTWLDHKAQQVPPTSLLGKAVSYTLGQWKRLTVYVEDGLLTPDNNLAENAIRPFVVGRKNWLFSGTPQGAWASATIYSLIETAKANGLEPYRYLRYLFETLPQASTADEHRALLPWHLSPTQLALPTDPTGA